MYGNNYEFQRYDNYKMYILFFDANTALGWGTMETKEMGLQKVAKQTFQKRT